MNKKIDTEAFAFQTDISLIEMAVERLVEQQEDPMAEPLTEGECYWLGRWLTDLPLYRAHNQKTCLTCAKERAILKLYEKPKRKPVKKGKKK